MQSQAEAQDAGLIGPTAPDDLMQNLGDFVGAKPRGFLDTAATAISRGWDETSLAQSLDIATAAANRTSETPFFTEQEYQDSEFFRRGVRYPQGAPLNIIQEGAKRHDILAEKDLLLSQRRPGIITGIANIGGQLFGQLLDPATIGAAFLSGGIVDSLKAFNILSKVGATTRAARVAQGIGRGAIEGVTITAPSTLARHVADNEFGTKNTSLDVLEELTAGAAFGGTLRGLGGIFRPVSPSAHVDAIKTAVKQAAADKSINIQPIIDNGLNEEILRQKPVDPSGQFLQESLTDEERTQLQARDRENLNAAETTLTKLKVKQIEIERTEPKKIRKKQSTSDMVRRLLTIARIPEEQRTRAQLKFMRRHQTHKEAQDTGVHVNELSSDIGDEDILIRTLKNSDELQFLKDRINRHKHKIETLDANLNEKDTTPEDKNVLRRDIDIEQHKLEMAVNRKRVLNKRESLSDKTLDARINTHEANMLAHDARLKIDEGNTVQDAIDSGIRPITKEGLSADVDTLESANGDMSHDPRYQAQLDQAVKSTPVTEEESVRLALETLAANPENEDYKQILVEDAEEEERINEQDKIFDEINICTRSKL